MKYQTYILSNGLRIISSTSPTEVAYCGFSINAGTRDEADDELGMAHFVEHLIFKGTTRRKAWHILNRMENVGGDLNAYTNKEETVVYSTFLSEHFARALELLTDIVFHSTFPDREIEKEVEVVIDEIQSYEDSPADLIYDDFENMLFRGHSLGRNILGSPERLRQYRSEDVKRFVNRYYHLDNMVLFVRSNLDFKRIVRTAERLLSGIVTPSTVMEREGLPVYQPQKLVMHRDTHQAHVMIGNRGYSAYDGKRTGLCLLNNMLGGPGMNSRLNVALRERRGLVYNVESNLTNYTDTGTFCIYFGCDAEDVDDCLELTYRELRRMRDVSLTSSQLLAAKKQIIGQIGVSCDSFEQCALDMGKVFLHYNRYEDIAASFRKIEELTSVHLQDIAHEILAEDRLSILIYK